MTVLFYSKLPLLFLLIFSSLFRKIHIFYLSKFPADFIVFGVLKIDFILMYLGSSVEQRKQSPYFLPSFWWDFTRLKDT